MFFLWSISFVTRYSCQTLNGSWFFWQKKNNNLQFTEYFPSIFPVSIDVVDILEKIQLKLKPRSSWHCKIILILSNTPVRSNSELQKICFKGFTNPSLELIRSLKNTQVLQYGHTITSELWMAEICHHLHHTTVEQYHIRSESWATF